MSENDAFASLFGDSPKQKSFKEMADEINREEDEKYANDIPPSTTVKTKRITSQHKILLEETITTLREQNQALQVELGMSAGRVQVLQTDLADLRKSFPRWKAVIDYIIKYNGRNRDILLLKNQAGPKNSNQKFMWRLYSLIHDMYIGAED